MQADAPGVAEYSERMRCCAVQSTRGRIDRPAGRDDSAPYRLHLSVKLVQREYSVARAVALVWDSHRDKEDDHADFVQAGW